MSFYISSADAMMVNDGIYVACVQGRAGARGTRGYKLHSKLKCSKCRQVHAAIAWSVVGPWHIVIEAPQKQNAFSSKIGTAREFSYRSVELRCSAGAVVGWSSAFVLSLGYPPTERLRLMITQVHRVEVLCPLFVLPEAHRVRSEVHWSVVGFPLQKGRTMCGALLSAAPRSVLASRARGFGRAARMWSQPLKTWHRLPRPQQRPQRRRPAAWMRAASEK